MLCSAKMLRIVEDCGWKRKQLNLKLGQENRTIKTVWSPHCGHVAHVELKEDKKPDSVKGLMEGSSSIAHSGKVDDITVNVILSRDSDRVA